MKAVNFLALGMSFCMCFLLTSCYDRDRDRTYPNNNGNYNNNYNNNPGTNSGNTHQFDEEFSGHDSYPWSFTDATDSAYADVINGSYQFVDYSAIQSSLLAVGTNINTQTNFSITTRIKSNKVMGLIFGASTSDNGYAFYIDTAGNYSLYKEGSGTVAATAVIPFTQDSLYAVKNNWNILEIDQANNTWTGYINSKQVFQVPVQSLSGANFGFKVLPGTTGYADYLIIKNY